MSLQGYSAEVLDLLARAPGAGRPDGVGWVSFDIARVKCPVIIVHGESDTIVPVIAARHTASLVPHGELRLFPPLGHFSVGEPVIAALAELARR